MLSVTQSEAMKYMNFYICDMTIVCD